MKRGLILVFLLLSINFVLAQEILPAGTLPDSAFYSIDRGMERMQLGIAGQGLPKGKLYIYYAEERVAEARALADKNNADKLNSVINDYQDHLARANAELEKAEGIGQDVSQLATQIELATNKHIAVLELVLAKAPDQSKAGIERALENAKENSAKMKEKNKKAGLFDDIIGEEELSQEELRQKAEELRKREEALNAREEEEKRRGLVSITGFAVADPYEISLLKQRMGVILLITIIGTYISFYYIFHRRHSELLKKYKKK